ncbi:MAG TPA: 3-deoxy-manno-octulosonate cytidylyltransferase [Phycisphaerae bacterium]|jgi:3-deoxy-manno-octulosonate cytidylyltransferase (CMP-KDO synthetase)
MPSALAVIPARFGAVRFAGKPLARQTGKYLVQHVYENARRARSLARVIVATDDPRISDAVQSFGGEVMMTRADHPSGTDRVAEVAARCDAELVLNVQGDEPEMEPEAIDRLVALMREDTDFPMGTLACPFAALATLRGGPVDPHDPNTVKVVVDGRGRALYFSRSLIPYPRDTSATGNAAGPLLHLGIYAYRRDFLLKLAKMPLTPLEKIEKLEQLRVLESGYDIKVGIVSRASVGIDTPEDYAAFIQRQAVGWQRASMG